MSASRSGLFFVATFFVFSLVQSTEFVPCFMWSNKRTNERVPALNKISQDIFKDEIQQYLKDDPSIVIFAEQTLSPEDFAQHDESGVTFSNLAKLAKSTKVSYLPYVQNPIKALKHLDVTVTEVPLDKFGKSFEIPETDILIVNLNDAKETENRIDMLKRHDVAITTIFQDLERTNDNILAIYTAHHTSWVASEDVVKSRQARSLLQADNVENAENKPEEKSVRSPVPVPVFADNFYNTSDVYLYVTQSKYTFENIDQNITFAYTIDTANATFYVLNAAGTSVGNGSVHHTVEVTITFTNTSSLGYWTQVSPITVKVLNATFNQEFNVTPTTTIYAPNRFSFHCGDQSFTTDGFKLIMKDFQVQLFFSAKSPTGKFDDAYDCVGFTTIPIWSGLFVTTILLIIMSIGITMLMDIRTMDRFDDPKGKTITINAE